MSDKDGSSLDADTLCDVGFWKALAPGLSIGEAHPNAQTVPAQSYARLGQRMQRDGYFGDADDQLEPLAHRLAAAIRSCVDLGLPPVFVWTFDQTWECYQRLTPVIGHFLGGDYKLLPNFWAWHIDPRKAETGWSAHRDKGADGLAPDGAPLALTCWIPLTEANPLNSCMYIIPAHLDPTYRGASGKPIDPTAARALPAKPGEYLIWNQAVLHWGSRSSEFAESPRMSIALEFQRGDMAPYNTPQLDPAAPPPFATRLSLIAKQILQYRHMYGFSDRMTEIATSLQAKAGQG